MRNLAFVRKPGPANECEIRYVHSWVPDRRESYRSRMMESSLSLRLVMVALAYHAAGTGAGVRSQ